MVFEHTIHFWTSFIAGIFVLLHIPSCNKHWAYRLKPFTKYLEKIHNETLIIATFFAAIHIILSLTGLLFDIWI